MTSELERAIKALLEEVSNYAGEPGYYSLVMAGEEVERLLAKAAQDE